MPTPPRPPWARPAPNVLNRLDLRGVTGDLRGRLPRPVVAGDAAGGDVGAGRRRRAQDVDVDVAAAGGYRDRHQPGLGELEPAVRDLVDRFPT
ncbi:MAG TPA: hypothetical protein PKA98_03285, partial [Acidimicrobiales bacterium]|nr:hypothetical protein [Acidimicrobiales bacterium]